MNYIDNHAVVEGIFLCVLFVSNFFLCHTIMCGRDDFLYHILLSQKLGHMLLSCFNVTIYFIIQEVSFSIIVDDFSKA